jgi:hypothetical protein
MERFFNLNLFKTGLALLIVSTQTTASLQAAEKQITLSLDIEYKAKLYRKLPVLIEEVGSDRTGGYYCASKASNQNRKPIRAQYAALRSMIFVDELETRLQLCRQIDRRFMDSESYLVGTTDGLPPVFKPETVKLTMRPQSPRASRTLVASEIPTEVHGEYYLSCLKCCLHKYCRTQ